MALATNLCEDLPTSSKYMPRYAKAWRVGSQPGYNGFGNSSFINSELDRLEAEIRTQGCDIVFQSPAGPYILAPNFGGYKYPIPICSVEWTKKYGGVARTMRQICPVNCGCAKDVAAKYQRSNQAWDIFIGLDTECLKS